MKKTIALISLLVLMLWLVGCNKKTVNINFPFEVGDVETIELYRYVGAPVSAILNTLRVQTLELIGAILTLKQLPLKKASCRSKLPRFNFWTGLY